MKFARAFIVAGLLSLILFSSPVLAFDPPSPPAVLPTFDPFTDDTLRTWFNPDQTDVDLWGMLTSVLVPYTDILGAWLFVILYALYIWTVYARTNGIALVGISLGITLPLWYLLFPLSTWYCPVIIFCLAVTATFYRLFKRR